MRWAPPRPSDAGEGERKREREGGRRESKTQTKTHVASLGQPGRHGDHNKSSVAVTQKSTQTPQMQSKQESPGLGISVMYVWLVLECFLQRVYYKINTLHVQRHVFLQAFFLFPSVSILCVPFCFQVAIKSFAKFGSLLTLPLTAGIFMDCSLSCTSLQHITGLPLCVQV